MILGDLVVCLSGADSSATISSTGLTRMLYGGHVKEVEHIALLRDLSFDFGEVILRNRKACDFWQESAIRNRFDDGFFLVAHGPNEGPPNDPAHLRKKYLPILEAVIGTAAAMEIGFLTVHFRMDHRFLEDGVLQEKRLMLAQIVEYAGKKGVTIGLENLSESAEDLAAALEAAPGLRLTLDVGHAELLTTRNRSFDIIADLGDFIHHVHLHDNRGGSGPGDDLHLPVGQGIVDFASIIGKLVGRGYDGTITLELKPEQLEESRRVVQRMVLDAQVP